ALAVRSQGIGPPVVGDSAPASYRVPLVLVYSKARVHRIADGLMEEGKSRWGVSSGAVSKREEILTTCLGKVRNRPRDGPTSRMRRARSHRSRPRFSIKGWADGEVLMLRPSGRRNRDDSGASRVPR